MATTELVPLRRRRHTDLPVLGTELDRLRSLEAQMDALLAEMHRRLASFQDLSGIRDFDIRAEVGEEDDALVVRAELPGFDESDVDVTLAEGLLTIKAERSARQGVGETEYALFEHSLLLPPGLDCDRAEARLSRGILTVRIPKQAEISAATRHIPIQRAESRSAMSGRYREYLADFRRRLAELREEVTKRGHEVAGDVRQRLEGLERLGERFEKRLGELEQSGESTLSQLRHRLERSWHEMSEGLGRLAERVRRRSSS